MYEGFTRHRSQHSSRSRPEQYEKSFPVSCANRTWLPTVTYSYNPWIGKSKWIDDCTTPGYHKLKRKKKHLPVNPLRVKEEISEVTGTAFFTYQTVAAVCSNPTDYAKSEYWGRWFTSWYCPNARPENLAVISDNTKENLRTEAWTKVMADRLKGQSNLVESIAQIDQAFRMVQHPLENVNAFIRNFRETGKRSKGFERVRADSYDFIQFISSEWLRFRNGINPLINDVRVGVKTLKKDYRPEPVLVTSKANMTINESKVTYGTLEASSLRQHYMISKVHTYDIRARCVDQVTGSAFNDLGLTFHNVVGLPWELTRLSYVVDWFVNVGDLIYANIPRVGAKTVTSYLTHKNMITSVITPTSWENKMPSTYVISGGSGEMIKLIDTVLIRSTPVPGGTGLVVKADFRLDNWIRACDASSLVIQRLATIGFGRSR